MCEASTMLENAPDDRTAYPVLGHIQGDLGHEPAARAKDLKSQKISKGPSQYPAS
jgi:hypothetical protein